MIRNFIGSCVLIVVTYGSLCAQSDSVRRNDLQRIGDGLRYNFTAPIHWQKKEWTIAGGTIVATAGLSLLDNPVHRFWQNKSDPTLDVINDVGDFYGKPTGALIAAGGFYLTGVVIKDKWTRETGVVLTTALITSAILQGVIKPIVGRARPNSGFDHYHFRPFPGNDAFQSFPSGHTTIALTISFVLAQRVKSVPLRIFFYSLAATTVFCRLYSDAHWISDVGLGGAIAWYSAFNSVSRFNKNAYRFRALEKVSLHPFPGGMTLRVALD